MSELKKRISEGEGVHLDFKFRIDDQAKIARTLSAFSNSSGGSLLIGVKDSGKISGCNPEEEYYMLEGAAELYCSPSVTITSKVWKEGHHLVLEVEVPPSEVRIKARDENGKWLPYYRIDDHSVKSNRVLDILWKMSKEMPRRPEKFTEEEIKLLKYIHEYGPVTISKLNRLTKLGFNELSSLIASLVHWEVINLMIDDEGLRYFSGDIID